MRAAESQVMARIAALLDPPGTGGPPGAEGSPATEAEVESPGEMRAPVPATAAGWVPSPPSPGPDPAPHATPDDAGDDVPEVEGIEAPAGDDAPERESLVTLQSRALTSAMAAYTAANGHPAQSDAFDTPGGRRWGMRARAGVVAAVVLVALGGVIVARSVQQTPSVVVADADAAPTSPALVQPEVVVHVVGQVAQPGLVRLPEGSRVADAVDAAGGAVADADLTAVNLARVLVDGEQVVISRPGEQPAAAGGPTGSTLLDLNTADAAALDELPGIGPVLAGRIVDWRTEHGAFTVVDELAEVTGIGPSLLGGVRDLVRVG